MIRTLIALVVQELHRPLRRKLVDVDPAPGYGALDCLDSLGRQERRCPFCQGWFNTPELQDAHERTCDQRPTDATPAEVLALAFPPYPPPRLPEYAAGPLPDDLGAVYADLTGAPRRGVLGRWTA